MQAYEWRIAARYLRPKRHERFISVIAGFSLAGIILGVAALIIVMSVMNGFRAELLERILGLNGHLLVQAHGEGLENYGDVAADIAGVNGVVRATPILQGQVLATAGDFSTGAVVRGVRPEDLAAMPIIADNIVTGSLDNYGDDSGIVVGSRLARNLGLMVGDSVTLIAPKGTHTAFGLAPRMATYDIAATFQIGMSEYDSSFIFMPLTQAQVYFKLPEMVTGVEVMLRDPDDVTAYHAPIREAVAGRGYLVDWQEMNKSFFNALKVERNVMFLILLLIILVAAFNIISGLIILVKDKGRDIAILRTMGATRGAVMRVFFLCGASIGLLGTAVGFALGLLFCHNIEAIRRFIEGLLGTELFAAEVYFLSTLPAEIDPVQVAAVVIASLGLSFLATLYPSFRAARLDPVEALRNE